MVLGGSLDCHALINTGLQAGVHKREIDISRFNGLPSLPVSLHSYSRCWLHLIWGTRDRERLLHKEIAVRVSRFLSEYAQQKKIYMKINYVNADHVHALIDLPTNLSIEGVVQLVKGSSSHWINGNDILKGKFTWGRGYGAFSVSESNVGTVSEYIARQKEHHRVRTFSDELKEFIERHGLKWRSEQSR